MKASQLAGSTDIPRAEDDFYRTPAHATVALLHHEQFLGSIWEPACGDGAISDVLRTDYTGPIISSDLCDRGYKHQDRVQDFLTSNWRAQNIITNPPYKLAQEFVEQALERTTAKVAMLLKLNFLEGQRRYEFFQRTPLKTVYVFSKRLSFDRGHEKNKGSGLLAYAWFVWDHSYNGKPTIDWIA